MRRPPLWLIMLERLLFYTWFFMSAFIAAAVIYGFLTRW